jgi:endo-1,4-beta-xylanase
VGKLWKGKNQMDKYEYHDVSQRGMVERLTYQTTNREGEVQEKYANVYLPYGYDETDADKKYNILYLMHGGGGNQDSFLDSTKIKNMLDYTIQTGTVEPLIVVFPSYYTEAVKRVDGPDVEFERNSVLFFQKELISDLLPLIETKYHTFAQDGTPEALQASRMHRGFSGFSMGGCTTWYTFTHNLDYFAEFLPLSGDSWEVEVKGGLSKTAETVKILHDCATASGYSTKEYFIHAATGTKDIACEPLSTQIEEMKKYSDTFVYEEDYGKGNFHYLLAEDEYHCYWAVYEYLYQFLPYIFQSSRGEKDKC